MLSMRLCFFPPFLFFLMFCSYFIFNLFLMVYLRFLSFHKTGSWVFKMYLSNIHQGISECQDIIPILRALEVAITDVTWRRCLGQDQLSRCDIPILTNQVLCELAVLCLCFLELWLSLVPAVKDLSLSTE